MVNQCLCWRALIHAPFPACCHAEAVRETYSTLANEQLEHCSPGTPAHSQHGSPASVHQGGHGSSTSPCPGSGQHSPLAGLKALTALLLPVWFWPTFLCRGSHNSGPGPALAGSPLSVLAGHIYFPPAPWEHHLSLSPS